MAKKKPQITEEQRKAFSEVGRIGGQKIAKKLGKKGMSRLGKRGAAKRLENLRKKQGEISTTSS